MFRIGDSNMIIKAQSSTKSEISDELYSQAISTVKESRKATISHLQQKLKIGYNKASGIISRMESEGLIGPVVQGKPREISTKLDEIEDPPPPPPPDDENKTQEVDPADITEEDADPNKTQEVDPADITEEDFDPNKTQEVDAADITEEDVDLATLEQRKNIAGYVPYKTDDKSTSRDLLIAQTIDERNKAQTKLAQEKTKLAEIKLQKQKKEISAKEGNIAIKEQQVVIKQADEVVSQKKELLDTYKQERTVIDKKDKAIIKINQDLNRRGVGIDYSKDTRRDPKDADEAKENIKTLEKEKNAEIKEADHLIDLKNEQVALYNKLGDYSIEAKQQLSERMDALEVKADRHNDLAEQAGQLITHNTEKLKEFTEDVPVQQKVDAYKKKPIERAQIRVPEGRSSDPVSHIQEQQAENEKFIQEHSDFSKDYKAQAKEMDKYADKIEATHPQQAQELRDKSKAMRTAADNHDRARIVQKDIRKKLKKTESEVIESQKQQQAFDERKEHHETNNGIENEEHSSSLAEWEPTPNGKGYRRKSKRADRQWDYISAEKYETMVEAAQRGIHPDETHQDMLDTEEAERTVSEREKKEGRGVGGKSDSIFGNSIIPSFMMFSGMGAIVSTPKGAGMIPMIAGGAALAQMQSFLNNRFHTKARGASDLTHEAEVQEEKEKTIFQRKMADQNKATKVKKSIYNEDAVAELVDTIKYNLTAMQAVVKSKREQYENVVKSLNSVSKQTLLSRPTRTVNNMYNDPLYARGKYFKDIRDKKKEEEDLEVPSGEMDKAEGSIPSTSKEAVPKEQYANRKKIPKIHWGVGAVAEDSEYDVENSTDDKKKSLSNDRLNSINRLLDFMPVYEVETPGSKSKFISLLEEEESIQQVYKSLGNLLSR